MAVDGSSEADATWGGGGGTCRRPAEEDRRPLSKEDRRLRNSSGPREREAPAGRSLYSLARAMRAMDWEKEEMEASSAT